MKKLILLCALFLSCLSCKKEEVVNPKNDFIGSYYGIGNTSSGSKIEYDVTISNGNGDYLQSDVTQTSSTLSGSKWNTTAIYNIYLNKLVFERKGKLIVNENATQKEFVKNKQTNFTVTGDFTLNGTQLIVSIAANNTSSTISLQRK